MWAKVLISNIQGIDNWLTIWNSIPQCIVQLDRDNILDIFNRKKDVDLYVFIGQYCKMVFMNKHSTWDDTTYIFFLSSDTNNANTWLQNTAGLAEAQAAHEEIYTILLNRYNRPVKVPKEQDWFITPEWRIWMNGIPDRFALVGLKATEYDDHWIIELI